MEEEQDQYVNVPLQSNNYDLEFLPTRRLPTIHVKMKTINIRRPTIYIYGNENEISQNYLNNNLSHQTKIVHSMPIINNNNNIIHNKTFTQANPNKYNYLSPQKRRNNLSYYSPVNSPDREKIEFINYGSPSKNQFNYTSYKRNINSPLKNNSLQMNNITSLSNYSTEECDDKIKILQDELNKSRKNLEQYKTNINKLENIINNLHSKNEQLSNENEKMKNILQNKNSEIDVDLLQKQFEDEKNKLQNEFELYKKQKEEEINLYNSKIEQLMNQINIYQNENQELKIKIEQISSNHERRNKYRIVKGDIIQDNKELEFLTQRICDKHKKITLNLLYKATVDSDKAQVFHLKCDSAPSSLVLIKSSKNKRFGGFTSCSWAGKDKEKPDENAFVFSLDKMEIYNVIPEENAIGCYPKYGPIFLGCQIRIYDNAFENGGSTFEKGLNYDTPEDYVLTGGEQKFGVEEIEVYGVEIE